jgi:hypothetical protein
MNQLPKTPQLSPWAVLEARSADWLKQAPSVKRQPKTDGRAGVLLSKSDEDLRSLYITIDSVGYPAFRLKHLGRDYHFRLVTHSENQQNRHSKQAGLSRFIGVSWYASRSAWKGQLKRKTNGKDQTVWSGYFKTEEAAARAYNEAAQRFGFLTQNNLDSN